MVLVRACVLASPRLRVCRWQKHWSYNVLESRVLMFPIHVTVRCLAQAYVTWIEPNFERRRCSQQSVTGGASDVLTHPQKVHWGLVVVNTHQKWVGYYDPLGGGSVDTPPLVRSNSLVVCCLPLWPAPTKRGSVEPTAALCCARRLCITGSLSSLRGRRAWKACWTLTNGPYVCWRGRASGTAVTAAT